MPVDLKHNHFELFGLPVRFVVDPGEIDRRYRELQREVHPDRFAASPAAEQRLSIELATLVNQAYQTLKSPLRRAAYLLRLRGLDPQFETNTAMPVEFLAEQMSWRERIEAASERPEILLDLLSGIRGESGEIRERLKTALDEARDDQSALETVRMLMFYEKLDEEIEDKLAERET